MCVQKQQHTSLFELRHLQTMLEQTSAALVAAQARLKETHAGPTGSTQGSPGRSIALHEEIAALKVMHISVSSAQHIHLHSMLSIITIILVQSKHQQETGVVCQIVVNSCVCDFSEQGSSRLHYLTHNHTTTWTPCSVSYSLWSCTPSLDPPTSCSAHLTHLLWVPNSVVIEEVRNKRGWSACICCKG